MSRIRTGPHAGVAALMLASLALPPAAAAPPQARPLAVEVASPAPGDVARTVEIAGSVLPLEETLIHAKVTGFVEEIPVDAGSRVRKGDLLVRLAIPEMEDEGRLLELEVRHLELEARIADARTEERQAHEGAAHSRVEAARAKLASAQAVLDLRRATVERFRKMRGDQTVTLQALDQAEADFRMSEAGVENARADLSVAEAEAVSAAREIATARVEAEASRLDVERAKASLARHRTLARYAEARAPYDGTVVERFVHTGALVLGGGTSTTPTPLVRIVRTGPMRIVVPVPEREASYVHPGTPARIHGGALAGEALEAKVTLVAGALTRSNRTMPVEIHASDPRLLPGMSVYVTLTAETHRGVLTLPGHALHYEKRRAFVWAIRRGKASKVPVTVGFNDLVRAEVRGLDEAAQVIVGSPEGLRVGKAVVPAAPGGGD